MPEVGATHEESVRFTQEQFDLPNGDHQWTTGLGHTYISIGRSL